MNLTELNICFGLMVRYLVETLVTTITTLKSVGKIFSVIAVKSSSGFINLCMKLHIILGK